MGLSGGVREQAIAYWKWMCFYYAYFPLGMVLWRLVYADGETITTSVVGMVALVQQLFNLLDRAGDAYMPLAEMYKGECNWPLSEYGWLQPRGARFRRARSRIGGQERMNDGCVGVVEPKKMRLWLPAGGLRLASGGVLKEIEVQ